MKHAADSVVSEAGATVYGSWCPAAAAKLTNVGLLSKDTIARVANKTAEACTSERTGLLKAVLKGVPKKSSQEKLIVQMLTQDEPVRKKFTEALTEAKKCGCPPSLCLFCKAATLYKSATAPAAAKIGAPSG
jgi:hypothetical protein